MFKNVDVLKSQNSDCHSFSLPEKVKKEKTPAAVHKFPTHTEIVQAITLQRLYGTVVALTVVVFQSGFQDGSNPSSIVGTDLVLGLHFCTQQVSCVSVFVFRH